TGTVAAAPAPSGSSIQGQVRNADGTPVPQAVITLISASGRQLGRAVARPDGSYALDTPGSGSYVLIAAADGHQPQATTVVSGEAAVHQDILLPGTGSLTGTVVAASDGRPLPGATVVVSDARGEVLGTVKTDDHGGFALAELTPGPSTAAVTAPGFRPAAMPVEVGATVPTGTRIALDPAARLSGTVRAAGADGEDAPPVRDALVTLVDAAGTVVASTLTGADGRYEFTDLDSGPYTLTASGYPPVAGRLTLSGEGADGHDITLAHPPAD
ncbi:MFS transporter, partial [Streptomyces sp. A7024]